MTDLAGLQERYLRAQLAGDRREAVRLVVEDGRDVPVEALHRVIQAAQDEIGRLWQLNIVSIAQEHMATAISQLALAAIYERAQPAPRVHKSVLLACVAGELHDLPARLAADALDLAGFDVRFLGANVPHEDLAAMTREERPDLIGLSVTMSFNVAALREAVSRCRVVTSAPIMIGGHALRWAENIARELGVASAGHTTEELIATAHQLLGTRAA